MSTLYTKQLGAGDRIVVRQLNGKIVVERVRTGQKTETIGMFYDYKRAIEYADRIGDAATALAASARRGVRF